LSFLTTPLCHPELVSGSARQCVSGFKKFTYIYTHQTKITIAKRAYHNYWVYILTNKPRGTLYIGVTGGIDDRMERHLKKEGSKFTARYNLTRLVYFEEFQYILDAIAREKQLKNWHRAWKINLIEQENPNWNDLWNPLSP